ncbi:MAG TPA: penicillin-binding protein 2 [Candidatus Cybelea sp.]|nr:penicillin-binding protein 2 [Candidatus Cybelea sp.]
MIRKPAYCRPRRPCTPADLQSRAELVRLDGAAKLAIETGRTRLVVAGGLFAVCFAILAARLIDLTLIQGGEQPPAARLETQIALVDRQPTVERASIVDRNGVMLAINLHTASVYADPRKLTNPREAATKLVKVLPELSQAALLQNFTSAKSFVWIKRNLTPKQEYAVNALGIPGVMFQDEQRRVYPQGPLAAHVLGFTNVDNKGIAGIEQFFDDRLRDPLRVTQPLRLSIDVRIQHALRDELTESVQTFHALGAAGVVMDVHTGELLAMVSLPDFDPTQANEATKDELFNRATLGVYEMGSVFKTFTMAMALDQHSVGMTGGYDATNPIHIARFTISDDHPQRRWLSVPEIYMYSSNIGAAKMALDVGPQRQHDFLEKMGMLRKPAVELPEVGAPLVPHHWAQIETMTIAFGHGLSVSPLQLATGATAVVNGGVLVPPTLIKRDPGQPLPANRVISAKTSDEMRRLMRLVVERGTGKFAEAPGYLVGGKTGTAEKIGNGGYRRHANLSSFVAAFPINEPRYVVLAVIDEPHGTKDTHGFVTAGWVAAPAVSRLITRIAPILGVPPVDEDAPAIKAALAIPSMAKDQSRQRSAETAGATAPAAHRPEEKKLAAF